MASPKSTMTEVVMTREPLALALGTAVIATKPEGLIPSELKPSTAPLGLNPWEIVPPPGWTYQWVRCALLGEPDPENVQKRLDNGWQFVVPGAHPGAPVSTVAEAVASDGLILMEKPTVQVKTYAEMLGRKEKRDDLFSPRRQREKPVPTDAPAELPAYKFPEVIFDEEAP